MHVHVEQLRGEGVAERRGQVSQRGLQVTENDPSAAATAVPVLDGVPVVVSRDSTTTFAPGTVVPVTAVVAVVTAVPEAGAVSVTLIAPGGACVTYRFVVTSGVSSARPAPMSRMSRSSWAWAQVSGDAEPAASLTGSSPRRTSSWNPPSITARWSTVGPPLPRL
jgi:hypothetical protein